MRIKIEEKLNQIATAIYNKINLQHPTDTLGLYNGQFGILLFLLYYSRYSNISHYNSYTEVYAEQLLNKLASNLPTHTFCSGLAGILYSFEFLRQNNFINLDISEVENDFENYLLQKMEQEIAINNYDFMHGALGIGLYFLKKEKKEKYIKKLIDFLYNTAEKNQDKTLFKWKSIVRNEKNEKEYNIALSHGMSSILVFLSYVIDYKMKDERIFEMIKGTANYILKQQIDYKIYGSYFPSLSSENKSPLRKSRLAWCYGDLGIAVSLWQTGKRINCEEYKQKSIEILLHSTTRLSLKDNFVFDAGICHGSAGIAMIYNRMYKETKIKEFLNAFNYWIEKTLEFSTFDTGIAGYKYYVSNTWKNDYSLLTGVSGIGLVLLSCLEKKESNWNEMLLIS